MKKMSCIIVEDEPIARKILREFIEQIDYLDLAGEFESAIKAEAFLRNNETDIMFLDIEMPKMTGLDFLRTCQVKPLVILTTAYSEYALEGYALNVIDYLLKPISFARFMKAIQKARSFIKIKKQANEVTGSDFLFVRSEKKIEKIKLSEILFIESTGNYVSIVFPNKKLVAYLTLKGLRTQLPKDIFLMIHRSYLVNFSKIESLENNHVKVGGINLPLGRAYASEVMKVIEERMLRR